MRLALISDTHLRHDRLSRTGLSVDMVLHAGDWSRRGTRAETETFLDWLATWDCPRVLTGGNHDAFAEQEPEAMAALCAERDIHWLCDRAEEVAGLTIYGSPWSPRFRDMAFNLDRGEPLAERWRRIPSGVDVLLTHTPPQGVRDRTLLGLKVGCEALLEVVRARPPRLHVFGHIHEAAGEARLPGLSTQFWNVASSRLLGERVRPPVVVEL